MTTKETDIGKDMFYVSVKCNKISTDEVNNILALDQNKTKKTGMQIPSEGNILTFKGIASQNYGPGEKSRNNYKYDQTGWNFDDYMNNPIILWQHNADYGGIGHAVQFWLDEEKNLNVLFYVDLDTLEPRNATQVKKWFVAGISTGASTIEYMFEDNKSGERMTKDEAEEKYGWENVWKALAWWGSDFITLVITKAKLIENSLVTIGSNEKAMAMQNSLSNTFQDVAEEYKNSKSGSNQAPLSTNATSMTTQKKDNEAPETVEAPVDAPASTETPAATDAPVVSAPAENTDSLKTEVNDVDALKNTIIEMQTNHANEIKALQDKYAADLATETDKIRTVERDKLAKVVNTDSTTGGDVKTPAQFKSKYVRK